MSASELIRSSTMPSMARRAARIRGVVPQCMRAFRLVERFRSKICQGTKKLGQSCNNHEVQCNYTQGIFNITNFFLGVFFNYIVCLLSSQSKDCLCPTLSSQTVYCATSLSYEQLHRQISLGLTRHLHFGLFSLPSHIRFQFAKLYTGFAEI